MRKIALALSLLLPLSLVAGDVEHQTASLVAMFNKTKHKSKSKHGVTKSMFLQIESEAVVRRDASSYSGAFVEPGFGYSIELRVRQDESATGIGTDHRGAFTLRDGRVRGALLTATKAYANGATGPLEAVFLQQTMREGTAPDQITSTSSDYGLGVRTPGLEIDGGIHLEKLFFEAR